MNNSHEFTPFKGVVEKAAEGCRTPRRFALNGDIMTHGDAVAVCSLKRA
jgi:hypothetical protein